MKQEQKSALSRQRILDAAMEEFSGKGYEGASLNTVWAEKGISKGIVYHHFRHKDELYLLCVQRCFDALTEHMRIAAQALDGTAQEQLRCYFDARLQFFAQNPLYLGLFVDALDPPQKLLPRITQLREQFDTLNVSVLTGLLQCEPLRPGRSVEQVAEDFRMYLDYFNLRFKTACRSSRSRQEILREHEETCHRQIDQLLYGVFAGRQSAMRQEEKAVKEN